MGIESLSDADLFALKAGRLDKVSDEGLMALKQSSAPQTAQPAQPAQPVVERPKNVLERNFPQEHLQANKQELGSGEGYMDLLNKAAYNAGGKVTDVMANMGASPNVAAGAGFATNIGIQSIPVVAGGAIGKMFQPLMESGAKSLMQSALKPSIKDLKSGKAQEAIGTMLDEGINVTHGGMAKLKNMIEGLNSKIESSIQGSSASIDKSVVGSKIQDVVNRIERTNPTPQDALKDVEKVYTQFMQNGLIPKSIPVTQAQELKQGIYQVLRDKYGTLSSDTVEAQKALARGFKEGIAQAVPEIASLNAQESKLINALNVAERRVLLEGNKNPMGMALLAKNPSAWAAFMADKSPLFKSLVARMMKSGEIPATLGATTGGLYSLSNSRQQPNGALATLAAQQNNQ